MQKLFYTFNNKQRKVFNLDLKELGVPEGLRGSLSICRVLGGLRGSLSVCGGPSGSAGVSEGLRGSLGVCGGLWASAGVLGGLRGSLRVCEGLWGSQQTCSSQGLCSRKVECCVSMFSSDTNEPQSYFTLIINDIIKWFVSIDVKQTRGSRLWSCSQENWGVTKQKLHRREERRTTGGVVYVS